ncbi:MAG TPA: hypothetical protein VGA99_07905, partial [bacterium]
QKADPLYRSIGAFVPADFLENAIEIQAQIGVFSAQYSHSRATDNLNNVASILKSNTRRHTASLSAAPAALFNGQPKWLPMVSYNFDRTHQFGDHPPENGGFLEIHIPDQMSHLHNASLDWLGTRWRLGYRLGLSSQDNRQAGRENADFKNVNNTFSFGLNPFRILEVGVDISLEQAESKELGCKDLTNNIGVNVAVQTTSTSTLLANFNTTHARDNPRTNERNNSLATVQWSLRFNLMRGVNTSLLQGQIFIRYARQKSDFRDQIFAFTDSQDNWSINSGVSLSLF